MADRTGTGQELQNGLENGAQGTVGAVNGVKNTVNGVKGTVGAAKKTGAAVKKLANEVNKNGIKSAGKKVGKKVGRAVKNAPKNMLKKILLKIVKDVKLFIATILIIVGLLGAIIVANTMASVLSAIGSFFFGGASPETEDALKESIEQIEWDMDKAWYENIFDSVKGIFGTVVHASEALSETMFSYATDWYCEVSTSGDMIEVVTGDGVVSATQEELDKLKETGEYDDVMGVYTQIIDYYLSEAYDNVEQEIIEQATENAKAAEKQVKKEQKLLDKGKTVENPTNLYDVEMTISELSGKQNPFEAADYAGILAAYSVTDDYQTGQLTRFKSKLHNAADGKFLTYKLVRRSQEKLDPIPIYVYAKTVTLDINEYDYYSLLTWENRKQRVLNALDDMYEIRQSTIDDCDSQIDKSQADKEALQERLDSGEKMTVFQKAEIKRKIGTLNSNINDYENAKKVAKDKQTEISQKKGECYSSEIDMSYFYDEKDTLFANDVSVVVYEHVLNADGNFKTEEITDEDGVSIPIYADYDVDGHIFCVDTGAKQLIKPEIKTYDYDEVVLTPYASDEDSLLALFDIDPDAVYRYSKSKYTGTKYSKEYDDKGFLTIKAEQQTITNRDSFHEYFDTLCEKLSDGGLIYYGPAISQTYGETLNQTEIQSIIDAMDGVSGTRREICAIALSCVGRIYYEWGGKYDEYGWSPDWGKPKGGGKYYGLDCSGFVAWVLRQALISADGSIEESKISDAACGTAGITSSSWFTAIDKKDLKPGDLGTKFVGGSDGNKVNHVGIYLGNGQWVHCTSSGHTVVKNDYGKFKKYWRVNTDEIEKDTYWKGIISTLIQDGEVVSKTYTYSQPEWAAQLTMSDDAFYTLAQCMEAEGGISDESYRACCEATYFYALDLNLSDDTLTAMRMAIDSSQNGGYKYLSVFEHETYKKMQPSQDRMKILQDVISGHITIFPPENYDGHYVKYWRTSGYEDNETVNYKLADTIGDNDYYYDPEE